MAYLGKARKEDLRLLAEELNLNVGDNMKIADLSKLITTHPDYDEEFSKNLLTIIVEYRKLREQQELVREQQEFEKEKEKLDREFQLEKLRLENERLKGLASKESIEKRHWVSALLVLMPSEINQLMARESEGKFDDYDYIKGLLLKRFKLSADIFRQKFVKHQRNPAQSWRDFVFEITSYFEEWLGGLDVNDFEGLKNLMITDQLKRRVPSDVREQFVDNWVKSIFPGDLADKLDEYESVRANVRGAHSNGHLARECPKNTRKTPPHNARSNIIIAKGNELEFTKEVVIARVSIPVSIPINTKNGIDDLRCGEGAGTIQIISAFGEKEIADLKLFNLKIDDGKHGSVPIMCAVSKKLVNDMLISATAYEILLESVQLFDFGNRRDFESTKDKVFRKEGLRKETENETRIREAMHKEEVEARLKAEVEARLKAEEKTKAVEERRRMKEERMNERIALEEEMIEERKMASGRADTTYVVAQPVAVEKEKGLSRNSSNVPPISAEDETYESKEKPKLPMRKLKELSGMSVTKLQRKVKLKASTNIVLVPQYWNFKREYSHDKRGIGILACELPGFIKRIGVWKVRQSLREREDQETTKVKMRKRVILKLRTHDNISRDFLNDVLFLSVRRERNWTFAPPPF
ncbi:uncharacterized protein TNIN_118591 [Trichonephila inaurata madagascariensis]|uniref:DUF382 domain-containing protein n=1 Tax=Trichonephila inaurata madagascariensis TaxID=2747483 RepID=A0A8X6Y0F7_9ARAC|nr:uncharacterized protein TNIN_118591 [Trichonephila inaurata madagascariensis]